MKAFVVFLAWLALAVLILVICAALVLLGTWIVMAIKEIIREGV